MTDAKQLRKSIITLRLYYLRFVRIILRVSNAGSRDAFIVPTISPKLSSFLREIT